MADEGKVPVAVPSKSSCKNSLGLCAGALLALAIISNLATNAVVIAHLVDFKNRAREEEEVFGTPDDLRLEVVQGLSLIATVTTETKMGDIVDCINAGIEYHPAFNSTMTGSDGEVEEVLVMTMAMRCQNGDVLIYPPSSTDVIVARAYGDGDGVGYPASNDTSRKLWVHFAYYGYRYGVPAAMFAMKRYGGAMGGYNFNNDINHVRNTLNGNYLRKARTMYSRAHNWVYTRVRR